MRDTLRNARRWWRNVPPVIRWPLSILFNVGLAVFTYLHLTGLHWSVKLLIVGIALFDAFYVDFSRVAPKELVDALENVERTVMEIGR
jgi:hypothetical protein